MTYDARGRATRTDRRIATPGASDPQSAAAAAAVVTPGLRYSSAWFTQQTSYDLLDRVLTQTTGAQSPELLDAQGTSSISPIYSRRGVVVGVNSSYGPLISKVQRAADGAITEIQYADAAQTKSQQILDVRRRVTDSRLTRVVPTLWSSPSGNYQPPPTPAASTPSTFQTNLLSEHYTYDLVGNPINIEDQRLAAEWPSGAKPVSRNVTYDDLYRVTRVDYNYPNATDSFVSPYQAELFGSTDPRRTNNTPAQLSVTSRIKSQQFSYDWLGSSSVADDDLHAFWDRGVGPVGGDATNGKPYRFRRAGKSADPQWPGSGSAVSSDPSSTEGYDGSGYDESGNLLGVTVDRPASMPCDNPTTGCSPTFAYRYDELGRLVEAKRTGGGSPARLRYVYDANDERVLKSDLASTPDAHHTVYIFDSLELRRTIYDNANNRYVVDAQTEVPYLTANGIRVGRVVYEGAGDGEPRLDGVTRQHVFLNMGDQLGSTSVVIDRATSELVERMTYQAYGATESDYRPDRWKGFREDYRFTGKEEDVEVGLTYFGKRFLSAPLGRWVSPDPLAVHAPGSADLNLYAYVHGAILNAVDPLGLDAEAAPIGVNLTNAQADKLGVRAGDYFFLDPGGSGRQGFSNLGDMRAAAAERGIPVFQYDPGSSHTAQDAKDLAEFRKAAFDAISGGNSGRCSGVGCGGKGTRTSGDFLDETAFGVGLLSGQTPEGDKNGVTGGMFGGKVQEASMAGGGSKITQAVALAVAVVAAVISNKIAARGAVAGTRAINLPGWSKVTVDMAHIAERHIAGGARTAGKTIFAGMNERGVMAAVRQAYGSATTIGVQGERVLLSGVTKTGVTVEMWLNKATNIIETAYPVVH